MREGMGLCTLLGMGSKALAFWFASRSPLQIGGVSTIFTLTLSLTKIWSIQPAIFCNLILLWRLFYMFEITVMIIICHRSALAVSCEVIQFLYLRHWTVIDAIEQTQEKGKQAYKQNGTRRDKLKVQDKENDWHSYGQLVKLPWKSSVFVVKKGFCDWNSSNLKTFLSFHPLEKGPSRGHGLSACVNLVNNEYPLN